ncbi:hypothetical protein Sgleb_07310 [Streptomyces glebosus]|uniref:Uncharacterized protein n=1 Tax=Streptomyces glebosus TaxID=249580 RepID=A0A640SP55_9ACTN|nr:hypothetical protein Sgleb_07310 [Streptomyces glebosus]GHG75132.1 hypothetical protein GCM10010513_49530 [Streptomyces glebosus]
MYGATAYRIRGHIHVEDEGERRSRQGAGLCHGGVSAEELAEEHGDRADRCETPRRP